ncbi:MAG: histidine--tRNA ligase [Saprospiraceae bacterium]|nr:histidine--tRNA ligase [Saprospiraceae bacterium]
MKPSIPKGTRDFLPAQVYKRNFIFDTIRSVFKKYGYQPIETPTMELLSTLTGKYGEEGDKLLFKVLNNGEFLDDVDDQLLAAKDHKKILPEISKRGLRYDLTVPFARYVVMHQNDIKFPFKRYHIQPVWRADRPQKGRYQEFYQCDVDVVGSDSLMYEAELTKILDEALHKLNVKSIIKINNRKILFGLAEAMGITDNFMDMTMAIDKLDKIGREKVILEMTKRSIPASAAEGVLDLLSIDNLGDLESKFQNCPQGLKGIEELKEFHAYLDLTTSFNKIKFDISLARGLNYYTGCIFEVEADKEFYPTLKMGSIAGGGRYDNLTGVFGLKDVSGVGVSFGAERIYDVMEEEDLFPIGVEKDLDVLLIAFDDATHKYSFQVLQTLRGMNIVADLYPTPTKMKKQMKYADARNVPYVLLIGSEEMESGVLSLKNMVNGEQSKLSIEEIAKKLATV